MASDPTVLIEVKLKDLFTQEFKKVQGEVNKFDQTVAPAVDKAASSFGMLAKGVAAYAAAWALSRGKQVLDDLAQIAARVEDMTIAFGAMTKAAGIDATRALGDMRAAVKGTVGDVDLMAAANRALMLGAAKTGEDLTMLAGAGRRLGAVMGLTAKQGVEDLATGIGRASAPILDNLGLMVKVGPATERYARSIDKLVENLTEEEKKTAFRVAAYTTITEKIKTMGPETDRLSDRMAILNVKYEEQKQRLIGIAEAYVEAKTEALEFLGAVTGDSASGKAFNERVLPGTSWGWLLNKGPMGQTTSGNASASLKSILDGILNPNDIRAEHDRQVSERNAAVDRLANAKREEGAAWSGISPAERRRVGLLKTQRSWDATIYKTQQEGTVSPDALSYMKEYMAQLEDGRRESMQFAEANARMASGMDKMWKSAKLGVASYSDSIGTATDMVADAVKSSLEAVESSLEDVLVDSMMGKMKTFKEYMLSLLEDISRAIAKMMVRMMIMKPLMGALEGATGIDFGMGSEGVTPHAAGGIFTRPHMGIVGDVPEAVIPLRGGKVPVEVSGGGGGGGEVHFHFHGGDGQSIKRMLHQEEDYLRALMRRDLGSDPGLRGAVRRTR